VIGTGIDMSIHSYLRKTFVENMFIRLITVVLLSGIFLTILFINAKQEGKKRQESRKENLSYIRQIDELTRIEQSLKNLTDFVNSQKMQLKESEDNLIKIREEAKNLEPALEAKREQISAVFELQEKRIAKRIKRERLVSFLLGIIASLFASSLLGLMRYLHKANRS
jgi:flagellar motility protein MotE (MotC chaperone)